MHENYTLSGKTTTELGGGDKREESTQHNEEDVNICKLLYSKGSMHVLV